MGDYIMSDEAVNNNYGSQLIITDWDGTCIESMGRVSYQLQAEPKLLPGVKDFFDYCSSQGSVIIIVTGRAESAREQTLEQIRKLGLWCSYLLCTGSNGRRILINDTKPGSKAPTAIGITVDRNSGLEDILTRFEDIVTRLSDIDEAYKELEGIRNKQQGN